MPKTPTQTDRPTEDITWDGSPLTRYAWQKDLPRRLTRANAAFRTLCEHGYVLERSRVICSTPSHRDNLYNNNVKRQSFQQPCELLTFTPINGALALVAVPPASAERYTIAPEILIETDSRMFEEIAETISNPKRREDYYHISAGSGVALLRILSQELTQQSPEIGAWAASEIANLQLTGVSSPTVAAFDDYRQKYEDLNGQLDAPATDASLAAHYFAQVRRLGDMLSTKLKLRMTTDSATGDLGKTVAAITAVLNEEEATSGSGQSFYGGRDPFRGKGNSGKGRGKGKGRPQETQKRVWIDGKDDICTVCNGEEQGGRHLRKDCPRNTSNTTGGRGGARAAASYPHFEYDDDDAVLLDADAIARAFDDGLLPDGDAQLDSVIEEAAPVGAARAARGRGRGLTSPVPFTPSPTHQPQTPSTQSSIDQLHANSPVLEMRAVARELGLRVDLSTGGKSHRTKFEILQDLRQAAGLPPPEPPTGIPLGSGVKVAAVVPPSLPAEATYLDHDSETTTYEADKTPWPWKGGPPRSLCCIVADGSGGVLHQHTFATTWSTLRDAAPSVFTCPLDGPTEVDLAPAGSVWLGQRDDDAMQLWGQRDGTLVCSLPKKPTASRPPAAASSTMRPAASVPGGDTTPPGTAGLGVSSVAALIVAIGAMLLTQHGSDAGGGSDIAKLSSPHDPGTYSPHWTACACIFFSLAPNHHRRTLPG